jgi:two-component system, NtrC family, sensor kinase
LKILVVDDEEECGEFFASVLEGGGAKTVRARSAEEGIETLRRQNFDLVLTDKNLPEMDGIGLIKFIRENYGDLPVILITGQGSIGSAVDAFKLGAQEYLLKPIDDPETLVRTVRSVMEHRRLENENKILQQKLIRAERMESLGMLAAGVAHEINNPTSFVLGNLELLKEDVAGFTQIIGELHGIAADVTSGDQKKADNAQKRLATMTQSASLRRIQKDSGQMIDDAIDGAQRIKRIVSSLRGFARIDMDILEPLDINEEVEKSLTLVWNDLKYKCKVTKQLQKTPKVIGNPSQIVQVLVNILINAGQAIDGKSGHIVIKTSHEKSCVKVEITDNGKGIPQEHMEHIFDPFFTTKGVGEGTGLGLYIAYGIMKQHGGLIEVTSKPDEGTTCLLTFPEGETNV